MNEIVWLRYFSNNLQYLMMEAGYTQKDLARATKMSEATISNYIHGKRIPTIKAIINIAYVLNIEYDELIDFGEMIS